MDLRPAVFALFLLASGPVLADIDAPTDMGPVEDRIKALIKAAASDTAQSWITTTPGEISELRPALGGAYMVLRFKDRATLAVFSVLENTFVKDFKLLDTECLFAAGGKLLVVYSPSRRLLQSYDLLTLKRVRSKSLRASETILRFEMGLLNERAAAVIFKREANRGLGLGLLDLASGRLQPLEPNTRRDYPRLDEHSQLRTDGRLELFTCWTPRYSPQGIGFIVRNGTRFTHERDHDTAGHLIPALEGRVVFSGSGRVFRDRATRAIKYEGRATWPVYGSPYYLTLTRRGRKQARFQVKNRETFQTVREVDGGVAFTRGPPMQQFAPTERQILAFGATDRLVYAEPGASVLRTVRLGLPEAPPRAASSGPGAVERGRLWIHKLPFKRGTAVVVEDAPEGVTFDEASMSLRWAIPKDAAPGLREVLISLIPPGGEERYDRVFVEVR